MKRSLPTVLLTISIATLGLSGCTNTAPESMPVAIQVGTDGSNDHAGHAHPSEGPHHGSLIELGNEEYHAELVHDEASGTVTIYVLDGAATQAVPIAATEVTINTRHEGKPRQFQLAASPDEGDTQGNSSRFVSEDAELGEHLHAEDAGAKLVLSIDGKSYRGEIRHDHDHDHAGHDHD